MSPDTRWFHDKRVELTDLDKEERSRLRRLVGWILAAAFIGACVLYAVTPIAAPIYQAQEGDTKIVLTDEECKLEAVSNLKKRATWTEKGQTFEGCWGLHRDAGVIMAYFSDKTVVILPPQMFVPVSGV